MQVNMIENPSETQLNIKNYLYCCSSSSAHHHCVVFILETYHNLWICRYVKMFAYKWLMLPALKSVGVWELQGKMIKYQFVYWLCLSRYISKYKNYVPISCISQHTTDRVMEKMKTKLYYFFFRTTDHLLYVFNFILFFSREKKNEQKYLEFLKEGVKRAQVYQ